MKVLILLIGLVAGFALGSIYGASVVKDKPPQDSFEFVEPTWDAGKIPDSNFVDLDTATLSTKGITTSGSYQ